MLGSRAAVPRKEPERWLAPCFVASGFAGVGYQVVLSREVHGIVGATAHAVSALLVAFMLGTSLGASIAGRFVDKSPKALRWYCWAEAGIGLYALAFGAVYLGLERLYLGLVPPIGSELFGRNAVRFLIGILAFLLPSAFMGMTTPAFARAIVARRPDAGRWLAKLYGWNTLGAAAGAFATAYVLVPSLGTRGSTILLGLLNLSIALVASRFVEDTAASPTSAAEAAKPWGGWPVLRLALVAACTGFLSFGIEVIWTHLLTILLGNSVYAFGLMLGSLLLGLGLGTYLAQALLARGVSVPRALGMLVAAAGFAVGMSMWIWDDVPQVFLVLARHSPDFLKMELMRLVVAMALMFVPTLVLGASFPLLLHSATELARERVGAATGRIYAFNTLGGILGALSAPWLLLPTLGSLDSLRFFGAGLLLVGAAVYALVAKSRREALLSALVAAFVVIVPVTWDLSSLNMAASIYLGDSAGKTAKVLFHAEDATGGLVSVVEDRGVRTLLTNGKFQGDSSEEIPIQRRLANIPTLFTAGRDRALVIGLGTGGTLATVAAHGFEKVVCAELSKPIIDAARTHFSDVNFAVLNRPGVELLQEDGRSVLLERPDRYDVISVEVSSLWFAGMGAIYSQEFYRLAASRLKHQGVMLQWFPVHHLSSRNLYLVVNTVRSVFPYVSVWTHRHQGFVIASNEPLAVDVASVRLDAARPELAPHLAELHSGSPLELLSDLVVNDRDVDGVLDSMATLLRTTRDVVSTDSWPVLEYQTPKDVFDNLVYFQNVALFRRFRSVASFPWRGAPEPRERAAADAAFLLGWGDSRALPGVVSAWREGWSESASRWILNELSQADPTRVAPGEDPPAALARDRLDGLRELLSAVSPDTRCEPTPRVIDPADDLPVKISSATGVSDEGTQVDAILDGVADPERTRGWVVRPDGAAPTVTLELPATRVAKISLLARPIDGVVLRTRIFGRTAQGDWLPISSGAMRESVTCMNTRVVQLAPDAPELTAIKIELEGASKSGRLALYEVWVEPAAGGAR